VKGFRLIIYLTPCIPLSFKGEGEETGKRGYASPGLWFGIKWFMFAVVGDIISLNIHGKRF